MEKVALILLSTLILSGCSSYGMQGNPAAVQAGAAIGGVLGAIVGDRAGGYNASQFGALAGTVAGCCRQCSDYAPTGRWCGRGI